MPRVDKNTMQGAMTGETLGADGAIASGVSPARRWLTLGLPWGASLAVHAVLVVLALGISFQWASDPGPPAGLSVTFDQPAAERARGSDPAEPSSERSDQPAPTPVMPAAMLDLPLPEIAPLAGLETETLLTPVNLEAVEAPTREAAAAAPPEFFGARGEREAEKIVYVVDASGSMVSAFASVARELRRSIDGLGSGQWFQVVLFNESAIETPRGLWGVAEGSLIRATPENRRAVFRWLENVRPERRSDPLPALERAMAFRPDLVFLLSKGILDG
ncbi:MAG: hypothetical protein IBJ10_08615, partial [Phycisphaerales bacterium]|nr:hypothetical protein [Phycisphaerales bacterium]